MKIFSNSRFAKLFNDNGDLSKSRFLLKSTCGLLHVTKNNTTMEYKKAHQGRFSIQITSTKMRPYVAHEFLRSITVSVGISKNLVDYFQLNARKLPSNFMRLISRE